MPRPSAILATAATHQANAIYAWHGDPEFWPPEGLGCSLCHVGAPIIWGLAFGALCDRCLERCLPGWDFERIVPWLGAQKTALLRKAERAEVFKSNSPVDAALAYERKYGVWLLEYPHP